MSSKLLYSLSSDDNSKQMGCINGLLHHLLTPRAIDANRHAQKRLPPPGQSKMEVKDIKQESKEKCVKDHKEKPSVSAEPSSTLSSAQPQTHKLSIKSSRKQQQHITNNPMKHIDSPRPLQPSNLQNQRNEMSHARRFSYDGRESRKESMSSTLKLNELPRLSLDSRQGKLQEEPVSQRQVSSILTKLMGLEEMSQSTPTRSSRSEDESETESERQSVSIYKEIDKRVADLDFRKAGKDLRALKHILDAMQRSPSTVQTSPSKDSVYRIKTIQHPSPRKVIRNPKSDQMPSNLPRVRTAKSDAKVSSPRTQQKLEKIEKFPQETRSGSNQEKRSLVKQKVQRPSKNMEVRTKKVLQRKVEVDEEYDIVHTPRPSQKLYKTVGHGLNVIEETTTALKEQPSPVSVLDADFYGDESPSPVKKKATVFRDDYTAVRCLAEDRSHLSNTRRSCFTSDNMDRAKESPDYLWINREVCTQRSQSQLRVKSSYPSTEHENEYTTKIIATDLAKRSESWTDFACENSWLVLDIERLIFKDLVVELVHNEPSR